MATQLQIRRGTTAQMNAFTGAEGELAVNTTTDTVHVHDGSTAGGHGLAKADGSNIATYAGSFTTLAASGAATFSSTLAVSGTSTMVGLALTGDITQSAAGARVTTSTTTGNGGIQNNNGTAYHLNFGSSHASEASNVWINSTGGSVKIKNAGNDVAVFNSTGVMIGTAALPSGLGGVAPQMVLKQGAANSSGIIVETSANDSLIRMYHSGSAGILSASYGSTGAYHPLAFQTGGLERMRIAADGNVEMRGSANVRISLGTAGTSGANNNSNWIYGNGTNLRFNNAGGFYSWETLGTERMRIAAAGNVGIGTTNFATTGAKLQVKGTSAAPAISGGNFTGSIFSVEGTSTVNISMGTTGASGYDGWIQVHDAGTGPNYDLLLNPLGGHVGIGTISPAGKTVISNGGAEGIEFFPASFGGGNSTQHYNRSGAAYLSNKQIALDHRFDTSGTERMRLTAAGEFCVGGVINGGLTDNGFFVGGNDGINVYSVNSNTSSSTYHVYDNGGGAYKFFVTFSGTIKAVNTTVSGISDIRWKQNIRDLDDGLEKVMQLQPRKFDWKKGKGKDVTNDRGFIAQEFETVFPDLIDDWIDPAPEGEEPYKAVRADLIPTLVKAIQEQQATIETLTQRIEALENN